MYTTMLLFHHLIPLEYVYAHSISLMQWEIKPQTKIFTRVNQNKIESSWQELPSERAVNFDQWKAFSENCKPIGVWLWFVYKDANINCCSQLFSEFI